MIRKNYTSILALIIILFSFRLNSQTERQLTLEQVINLAQEQSLESFISKNLYLTSYWEYREFKAQRRPWLEFNPSPSYYNNSIKTESDKEGTYLKRTDELEINGNLALSQNISLTGGKISVNSNLKRLQDFTHSDTFSYAAAPISIGIYQPIFQFNKLRWDKKIEPLKFDKAKKEYIESMENIALKAVNQFFNLLDAEQAYKIAELNKRTADTLFTKSKGRYERGALAYNDLQRLELNMLNAKLEYERAKFSLDRVRFDLKSFLRLPENDSINLIIPINIPSLKIVPQEALNKALENNPSVLGFRQRLLEADMEIARAKGDNGINSSIGMSYGLSRSGHLIEDAYHDLDKDRIISMSLYVPIVDWGLSKGAKEKAKSSREVTSAEVEIDRINFENDVIMSAIEFNMLESQLEIAKKANFISEKTYKTIEDRFLLGKENLETLYAARNERDNALRSYYKKIREFWAYYYYMRRLTLYNFDENISLYDKFDEFFGLK